MTNARSENTIKLFMIMFFGFISYLIAFVSSVLIFSILGTDAWYVFMYSAITALIGIAVALMLLAYKKLI